MGVDINNCFSYNADIMQNFYNKTAVKALQRAIVICKTQKNLARLCGVTQQQIPKWLKKGVPHPRVLKVEWATKGLVTRYELRPDLYPDDYESSRKTLRNY